jgi:hypothetical protein
LDAAHTGFAVVAIGFLIEILVAHDVGWVSMGQIVQGVTTGAATTPAPQRCQARADETERLRTILGSGSPTAGVVASSLLAGVAIQLTPPVIASSATS